MTRSPTGARGAGRSATVLGGIGFAGAMGFAGGNGFADEIGFTGLDLAGGFGKSDAGASGAGSGAGGGRSDAGLGASIRGLRTGALSSASGLRSIV